jgi:hypothetical protein
LSFADGCVFTMPAENPRGTTHSAITIH